MASTYPTGLDSFPTGHQDDAGEVIHAFTVNDLADAVNRIETELGTNPKGSYSDVKTRLNLIDFGNSATADVVANAADTYLTGSQLLVAGKIQASSFFRWQLRATKTAAGTAAPTINIRYGTAGSVADTSRVLFTGAAQTAVTDTGFFTLTANFRAVGATATLNGILNMDHTSADAAGLGTFRHQQTASGTFDSTVASSIIGLSVNPGASGVWTFQLVSVSAHNLLD